MAETRGEYWNTSGSTGPVCGSRADVKKSERTTGRDGKTGRTASNGLSVADHEFQKISSDYLRNCPKEGRYAYEAVTTTCHEMDSGVAELEAYRRFGERCGQMKYKTFSTILIQNLQKGGHRMADLLEKEALEAWDERKRKARVMGETAATKLLVPMIMMLAVVMAIIMIPAFLSFYG